MPEHLRLVEPSHVRRRASTLPRTHVSGRREPLVAPRRRIRRELDVANELARRQRRRRLSHREVAHDTKRHVHDHPEPAHARSHRVERGVSLAVRRDGAVGQHDGHRGRLRREGPVTKARPVRGGCDGAGDRLVYEPGERGEGVPALRAPKQRVAKRQHRGRSWWAVFASEVVVVGEVVQEFPQRYSRVRFDRHGLCVHRDSVRDRAPSRGTAAPGQSASAIARRRAHAHAAQAMGQDVDAVFVLARAEEAAVPAVSHAVRPDSGKPGHDLRDLKRGPRRRHAHPRVARVLTLEVAQVVAGGA